MRRYVTEVQETHPQARKVFVSAVAQDTNLHVWERMEAANKKIDIAALQSTLKLYERNAERQAERLNSALRKIARITESQNAMAKEIQTLKGSGEVGKPDAGQEAEAEDEDMEGQSTRKRQRTEA